MSSKLKSKRRQEIQTVIDRHNLVPESNQNGSNADRPVPAATQKCQLLFLKPRINASEKPHRAEEHELIQQFDSRDKRAMDKKERDTKSMNETNTAERRIVEDW